MSQTNYSVTKWVWTDKDFADMGWHDANVHAFASIPETFEWLLDIDYILQWVDPVPPDVYFSFWIVPATLVFNNVWNVEVHLDSASGQLTLQGIHRQDEQRTPNEKMTSWLWTVEGNEGSIQFRATGYTQYFRSPPIYTARQELTVEQRSGLSFSRTTPVSDG